MCDAQHLEPLAQRPEPAADDLRHAPADAGVHLVEDQRLAGRLAHGQRLQRQHDTGQLAAGDNPCKRPQLFPGIWRNVELGAVNPAFAPFVGTNLGAVEANVKPCALHREPGEQRLDRARELPCGLTPLA